MLDLFNREVVGWTIKPRMTADIVTDALRMAWFRRKPGAGVTFHRDRGSQYASQAMAAKLAAHDMTASMSRKFEHIEVFYNRSRRHATLGYSSPVRLLENWISEHVDQPSKAEFNGHLTRYREAA